MLSIVFRTAAYPNPLDQASWTPAQIAFYSSLFMVWLACLVLWKPLLGVHPPGGNPMSLTFTVPERDVIAWRRHLHMYPELSFPEHQTAHFVEGKLHDFGIETTRPTETSVVGTVEGTREADPDATVRCVALRADIDALPVQESSGLSFASTVPGVMHACGHDAHTAMLLGTAKVLADNRDQFSGTVKLIFQHAEELNPGGAQAMVDAGVLEGVDQIYGLHVMNGPVGTVQIAHGNTTSSAGGGFITIQGVGSPGPCRTRAPTR